MGMKAKANCLFAFFVEKKAERDEKKRIKDEEKRKKDEAAAKKEKVMILCFVFRFGFFSI